MSLQEPRCSGVRSHARHHTDTVIVGRDPEIAFPPALSSLATWVLNLLHVVATTKELWKSLRLSLGPADAGAERFPAGKPTAESLSSARFHVGVPNAERYLCHRHGIVVAVGSDRWGRPHYGFRGCITSWATTQHAGLAEDVPDTQAELPHNPSEPGCSGSSISNMNYHAEHHMYPMVPFIQSARAARGNPGRLTNRPTLRCPRPIAKSCPR